MLKPSLRLVAAGDEVDLWRWRNDPETRLNSVNCDEVAWSDHLAWFQSSIANPDRILFIIEVSSKKCGMIRFDKSDVEASAWEVSIAISLPFRGRGIGGAALRDACAEIEARNDAQCLTARIRRRNGASLKIFERCGFSSEGCDGDLITFSRRRGRPRVPGA